MPYEMCRTGVRILSIIRSWKCVYIHAILNLCMCIVHACMKKYTVLCGMLTKVRGIVCELYAVQRSVGPVTSVHLYLQKSGFIRMDIIQKIVVQKINKQCENTLEFLYVGLVW